jgi:hypothetical protein
VSYVWHMDGIMYVGVVWHKRKNERKGIVKCPSSWETENEAEKKDENEIIHG